MKNDKEKYVRTQVCLTKDTWDKIEAISKRNGCTISWLGRKAITEYFNSQEFADKGFLA